MYTTAKYPFDVNQDFSETVAYNNPLFPAYIRYGVLSTYPDYSGISHWHEDLEFIVVKKGQMTYNVNGELVPLTRNNGIMVNSRQLHYGFSAKHHECEFLCILLSPELLQGNRWFYQNYIEHITASSSCPYLYLDCNDWRNEILELLDIIHRSSYDKPIEHIPYFDLLDHFLIIMKTLYENLKIENAATHKESSELTALKNMLTYIEEHYTEHITLEKIALAGACCKSRCSLLFKKYLRDTPITYTTKLRLRKSLTALLESDAGITEIAYENGFGGASYYCETFQKYYKISPLKYRKTTLNAALPLQNSV